MNPNNFIAQYNGQQIDLDGFPKIQPFQCYDLANQYSLSRGYGRFGGLNAYDIFGQQPDNYTWVANTPEGVPPAGAVVVWDGGINNGPGHVAIATGEGNNDYFVSLDQNWGAPRCMLVRHNYNHVIGWGIPKNLSGAPAQGDNDMIVNDENNYARFNKLHMQVRGRPVDRATFNAFVGSSWLHAIEVFSDDPEANQHEQNANIGALAVKDNWQQQIYTLQDQNKVLQAQVDSLAKQVKDLQAQVGNNGDTQLLNGFGSLLQQLIIRLGIKK